VASEVNGRRSQVTWTSRSENPSLSFAERSRKHWSPGKMQDGWAGSIAEPLKALVELQQQGLIRHLGLSNVTPEQSKEAQQIAEIVAATAAADGGRTRRDRPQREPVREATVPESHGASFSRALLRCSTLVDASRTSVHMNTYRMAITPRAIQELFDELEASRQSRRRLGRSCSCFVQCSTT
jgi:Aldo/keto reductase family